MWYASSDEPNTRKILVSATTLDLEFAIDVKTNTFYCRRFILCTEVLHHSHLWQL